jgi:hypothetical protein
MKSLGCPNKACPLAKTKPISRVHNTKAGIRARSLQGESDDAGSSPGDALLPTGATPRLFEPVPHDNGLSRWRMLGVPTQRYEALAGSGLAS